MKSITLAAAVALLVGGTALGADTSTIAYELELGGNNQVEVWEDETPIPFANPPFLAVGSGDDYPAATASYTAGEVITWDVVVQAYGQLDDGSGLYISGATNLVFSLELYRETCPGDPATEAIFLSTMNDGDNQGRMLPDPLEMAAFCHIFNVPCPDTDYTCPDDGYGPDGNGAGPGRAWDQVASGGPRMDRAQYASTATHAGGRYTQAAPVGHKPAGGTGVVADPGALAGKLVGMGVGYSQFNGYSGGGNNVAGVGIDSFDLGGICYRGLGYLPIVEGQIDTTDMAGTYCLKLVPGTGNNVMPGELDCQWGGDLASFAKPANTVVEDMITFYVEPVTVPCSIDAWYSVRDHDEDGDLAIELDASASGAAVVSESRRDGVQKIEIDITASASVSLTATIQAEDTTVGGGGGLTAATSQTVIDNGGGSYTVVAQWTAGLLLDEHCYKIDLAGKVDCDLTGDTDCSVRVLEGDTNDNTDTNLIDFAQVKSLNGTDAAAAGMARFDVTCDGDVNLIDAARVKSLNGNDCDCP